MSSSTISELPTDHALVAAYAGGDEQAAAELVRRHAAALGRFLYSAGARMEEIEDLVQEALFRAFRGLPGWRRDASFRSWLFTIGGNLLLDTRCNYYDQNYEWRKAIHFCMKKDGEICWVAPSSPRCWAVQSSDCAPVMVALGAQVKLVSSQGERMIPAAALYNDDGIQHLHKRPDELLTEIHLPPTNGWRATYWKLRRRGAFDFPVLGVATWVQLAGDGTVENARIILGGVGSLPIEAANSEIAILGKKLTEETIEQAAGVSYAIAKPLDNTDFAMDWRKHMARYYVAGTLRELAGLPPRPVSA